jgi:hypothetical protein
MKPTIQVASPSAQRKKYAELLRNAWIERDLEIAADLVRAVIETGTGPMPFDWETQKATKPAKYPVPANASEDLKEFLERANTGFLLEGQEPSGEKRPGRNPRWERLAFRVARFVTIQADFNVTGEVGFLRDCQSALIGLSTQFLLPKLAELHLHDEFWLLARAMLWNTQAVWLDNPAHQHYLASVVFEGVGRRDLSRMALKAALDSTDISEHDFITKVQTYWSSLVEDGLLDEAKSFLLKLYRRASHKDLDEIEEILDVTYQQLRAAGRAA